MFFLLSPSSVLSGLLVLGLWMHPTTLSNQNLAKLETGDTSRLPLINTDTLLYVDNRGLDRIFVTLSGHTFRLVADSTEVGRSANAYPIPREGAITIHVGTFIDPEGENYITLASQGPPNADADVIVAPVFVRGQSEIAYHIRLLEPIPARFRLQNYPNPFRERTTIRYEVADRWINGVEIEIGIFDSLGRRIDTLNEGLRYPGLFRRTWTVPSEWASGVFYCRILAKDRSGVITHATHAMVVLRGP